MTARFLGWLNGKRHRAALNIFMVIVLAHWAEHLIQAYQVWGMGMHRPHAKGLLGHFYPWLVDTEWLHYSYALVMLIGLFLLLPGFGAASRSWWTVALVIQFWHHIEHLLLLIQVQAGVVFFGAAAPTSVLQLVWPRVELHLFYNAVVFVPMVIGMYLHRRPSEANLGATSCSCVHKFKRLAPPTLAPARLDG